MFIPQLYGNGNDYDLMRTFCCDTNDYFVVTASDERYDTYFQQYLIGQLYAVIGMRYHSNIFLQRWEHLSFRYHMSKR